MSLPPSLMLEFAIKWKLPPFWRRFEILDMHLEESLLLIMLVPSINEITCSRFLSAVDTSELMSLAKGMTAAAFKGAAFSTSFRFCLALLGKLLLSKLLSLALRSAADIVRASASSFAPPWCVVARSLIILFKAASVGFASPLYVPVQCSVLPEKHAGWLLAWLQCISRCSNYCRQEALIAATNWSS